MPTLLATGGTSPALTSSQTTKPEKQTPSPANLGVSSQAAAPYYYAWRNRLSTIPTDHIIQNLNYAQQYGGEVLPVIAPRLASATPIISGAFAGYAAYDTFRREYNSTKDLPPKTRYQKLAAKAGDITLFHLFANLVIPGLLARKTNAWIKEGLKNPRVPGFIARHPKWVTALALTLLTAVISKPVNKLVNFILDWTYRPLVEKRKREKWQKLYNDAYYARVEARRRARQAEQPLPPPVKETTALEKSK